jgi:hypothetical protein
MASDIPAVVLVILEGVEGRVSMFERAAAESSHEAVFDGKNFLTPVERVEELEVRLADAFGCIHELTAVLRLLVGELEARR